MKSLPFFALVVVATGCSSLRVIPASDSLTWSKGTAYAASQSEELSVELGVAESAAYPLRLMAVVTNKSDAPAVVMPTQFHVRGAAVEDCGVAEDPEIRLEVLRRQIGRLEPTLLEEVAELGFVLSSTAAIIGGETREEEERRRELEAERRDERAERRDEIAELREQEARWESRALRTTTLAPGQSVRGFIQFECSVETGEFDVRYERAQPPVPFKIVKR